VAEFTTIPALETAALNVDINAGLLNRSEFYQTLASVIQDLRTPNMHHISLGIPLVDLRALKALNDEYAPELGDMALLATNIALRQTTHFPTRFYGDDFGGLCELNPYRQPITAQTALEKRQNELQSDISAAFVSSFLALGECSAFSWVFKSLSTSPQEIIHNVPTLGVHVSLKRVDPDRTCNENMFAARQALKYAKKASRAKTLAKLSPDDQLRLAGLIQQIRLLTGYDAQRNLGIEI